MLKKLNQIQANAKKAALKALKTEGKALLHMATGTGKTETGIKIYSDYKKQGKRMLWLTHKNDLVDQSAERMVNSFQKSENELLDLTFFDGKSKDNSGQVVVASVQSLSKASALAKFDRDMFDLIIVDEAHHAPAASWTRVIEYFNADRLALTATPFRPDKGKVHELFNMPCFTLRFSKAQEMGLLAPVKAQLILTNSSITGMNHISKDFSKSQLEKLYVSNDRNAIIVKSYKDYGRKQVLAAKMKPKAICFCINTKHAKRMAQLFNKAGIKSDFISSNSVFQKADKRSEVFENFVGQNSKIEILCAVDILNEGTDIPDVNIGLMARPTRSNIIYTQQIGRLARSNGGKKKFFVVLDYIDQTRRQYSPYTAGNLIPGIYAASSVVTKYVLNQDPVETEERIDDIMSSVEEFEDQLCLDLLKTKEEIEKEDKYLKKFGKHSKEVLNANIKSKAAFKN